MLALVPAPALAAGDPSDGDASLREAVLVANAEEGSVAVVDAQTLDLIRTVDVLPDGRAARLGEDDPLHALAGQALVEAAGGENYAQDQDVSPDGRTLYVSRGHRGDVAAFDLAAGTLLWKVPVSGLRADHMTMSPDGRRLYVSALTADRVEVIDTARRAVVTSFPTGEWPHDNHLSHDGRELYNASIGNIVTPSELRDAKPGTYRLTVVDPHTLATRRTYDFDRGIRPYVITADNRRMYAQLSEYHGLVEYDLEQGHVLRRVELPVDPGVSEDDYDFEAPHHGLALSHDEQTLCAAGRASDYVALISTAALQPEALIEVGDAPGWAAAGPDGRLCFVPNTREDTLSVVSFAERREIARIPVGNGPKQIEAARLPADVVGGRGPLRLAARCTRRGALRVALAGNTAPVRQVDFKLGRGLVARDAAAPFRRLVSRRTLARRAGRPLRAVVHLHDGTPRRLVLERPRLRCSS